jgi:hypothetical protein
MNGLRAIAGMEVLTGFGVGSPPGRLFGDLLVFQE